MVNDLLCDGQSIKDISTYNEAHLCITYYVLEVWYKTRSLDLIEDLKHAI